MAKQQPAAKAYNEYLKFRGALDEARGVAAGISWAVEHCGMVGYYTKRATKKLEEINGQIAILAHKMTEAAEKFKRAPADPQIWTPGSEP